MTIALDFDGTLVKHKTKYVGFDTDYEYVPGAREAVFKLAEKHSLVLNTARPFLYRLQAIVFIMREHLPIKTPLFNGKPQADLYIDDLAWPKEDIDWKKIIESIDEEKTCTM